VTAEGGPVARPVDVSVVRPVRGEVLRAGRPLHTSVMPLDDHEDSRHLAVFMDDEVVSVGSILPGAPPWEPDAEGAWRVRGMATREGHRSRGYGEAVLAGLLRHARDRDGRLVWCAARLGATNFYARAGFETEGELFVTDDVEHIHMWRPL